MGGSQGKRVGVISKLSAWGNSSALNTGAHSSKRMALKPFTSTPLRPSIAPGEGCPLAQPGSAWLSGWSSVGFAEGGRAQEALLKDCAVHRELTQLVPLPRSPHQARVTHSICGCSSVSCYTTTARAWERYRRLEEVSQATKGVTPARERGKLKHGPLIGLTRPVHKGCGRVGKKGNPLH